MMTALTRFEEQVQMLTARLLEEYRPTLNDLELQAELRSIDVLDASADRRTSELKVVFLRGREFADVFEFFVEKDGSPSASLFEIEEWLRGELADLPARHSG